MSPAAALRTIKLLHTIAWAVFAGCILAIPLAAWRREFQLAICLIAIVSLECLVLAVNRMRCPLTDVAARYTDERHANFDIYLPLWLARYNKVIFGSLFAAGLMFTLVRWQGWL
jgi:hypothetical protein